MKVNSYKDLIVWQKSVSLVEIIYKVTLGFPKEEVYGLTSQIRRASVSIPSNIAEGYGRKRENDYKRFYRIAYGSALELETQLEISNRLKYLSDSKYMEIEQILIEICKMLNVMSRSSSLSAPAPNN